MTHWVIACGVYSFIFGVFHILFWRLFDWNTELPKLSKPNRAILQILNLRQIYSFFLIAVLCFLFPEALVVSPLGNALLVGCSLFWVGRTIEQFIFLRINHYKVHLLTVVFVIGSILFLIPIL